MRKALIILLLTPLFVFSQNFAKTWQQCYGGSSDDRLSNIISYKYGYLFFGGTTSIDGDITNNYCGGGAAWLVNIDNKGDKIFDSCYCGFSGASGEKIVNNFDDGFYLTGSSGPNHSGGINGYWLAKIDTNFNVVWQDVLGGSYIERPKGASIAQDGGIIEFGLTGSDDGDIEEYYGDFDNWLVKLNPDGSKGWIKTYGNIGSESGGGLLPTHDGGYIYACSGYNQLPGNIYCEGHDAMMAEAWLIKLDDQGIVEWNQCYGGADIDLFVDVIELNNGYIALGTSESSDGDLPNHYGTVGESSDIWIVRVDNVGELLWSKVFGGTDWDYGSKIFQNENNTFTILGKTKSHNGDVQGNSAPSNYSVVWMLKIDENGELIYQKPFDELVDITGIPDFIRISDYKFIAAVTKYHNTCNYSWNNHNNDIYVFEIQDMDEFIPSQPMGVDRVCLGEETESYYTTTLVVDTMQTQWLLEPEEAGIITAMHDSVLINWNMEFNDTAWLQVKSINIYGESSYSVVKEIIVYSALNLLDINGPDSICTITNEQTIFTTNNPESLNLNWYISPSDAGTILTQEDTAIIMWDSIYEGVVELRISTINYCGNTVYSPIKEIQINTCLGTNESNYTRLKVYPNPAKEYMIFMLPQNVKQNQLRITDIYGKNIKTIPINKNQQQIKWDCRNVKSGVYFYQTEIQKKLYKGKILIK